ncbi:MAG: CPBP family intramembrane glutamic endopeptidase, partial [Pseudomonadales bacterium]|nr:CPBP family intramembrane glutamic endopeptidase [Pseudomonadales bacterium]
ALVALAAFRALGLVDLARAFAPLAPGRLLTLALCGVLMVESFGIFRALLPEPWAVRELGRFDHLAGDTAAFLTTLATSWVFAAFGEELVHRGLLMQALTTLLGRPALALLLQAAVFGAVHLYQGPAGVLATLITGLVFGILVLVARGSLWPAVLAHGTANTLALTRLWLQ